MNAHYLDPGARNRQIALTAEGALDQPAFWRRVNALANAISRNSAQRWALICEDSSWFVAGLLALAHTGRTIVLPQAPQAGSLEVSGVQFDALLTDHPERFSGLDVLLATGAAVSAADTPLAPDDSARIESYTSGSSGTPKCVPKRFAQLRLEAEALEREWGFRLGDALVVGSVPHYHLYGLMVRILWPLLSGRTFLAGVCLQPAELCAVARAHTCIIVSSPAFLSRITDSGVLPAAGKITALFSSGAPLPDATAAMLANDWGHAAIEIYGSTETGGIAWRAWSGAQERPLWRLINGVQIELRAEPAGERLWVRSGFTWQADWMATGDLARRQEDGRFALLGRADDVVKFEDKRVSLSEIRSRLLTHAWVKDARLLLVPGRRTLIGAVVVLSAQGRTALAESGQPAVRATLRAWLRNSYEPILVPRKWRFLDDLPDNDMGKIEHTRLQQLFEKQT